MSGGGSAPGSTDAWDFDALRLPKDASGGPNLREKYIAIIVTTGTKTLALTICATSHQPCMARNRKTENSAVKLSAATDATNAKYTSCPD
jgi:hypothetical protein